MPHARIVAHRRPRAPRTPGVHLVLTGARLADPLRHPAGEPGRARARRGQGALRRRSGRGRRRARRGDGVRGARADRRRVRAAAHVRRPATKPGASRAAHSRLRRPRQHPQGGVAGVRRRRAGARRRGPTCSRTSSSTRATRTCRSSSTRRWRRKDPDGKLVVWSSTQTPHYLHRALAKALAMPARAHPRHRHAERRRLRRQERSVQSRDRRREGGAAARSAGEDLPDARGGVLLPSRPSSGADALPDRREEATARSPACTCRRCSTAARTDPTAWRARSTPARCRPSRTTSRRISSAAAACSRTSRRAGPSADTARRRAASGRKCSSTRSPSALGLDPAELRPSHRRAARHAHGQLPARRHHRPRRVHPPRRRRRPAGRTRFRKLPHGRGLGLACSSYLSGAGLPIYWNDMPHSGVQLKLDRSGGVTAFCGATEIGQGSDDVLVGVRGRGARHRAVRHPRR